MYRLLDAAPEIKERRNQVRRPHYAAPELLATRPNEVWSWDITKLLGPAKWTYFYLYVILDIFSRYVVGWMLASNESAALAERFIAETCAKHGIPPGQLTLHADRGSSMRSKPVALLLADLAVTKTHSRPHVSNDDPFSEAQFKTLKYSPALSRTVRIAGGWPGLRAGVLPLVQPRAPPQRPRLPDARRRPQRRGGRGARAAAAVLAAAYAAHPERFVKDCRTLLICPGRVDQPAREEIDRSGCPRIDDRHLARPTGRPDFRSC